MDERPAAPHGELPPLPPWVRPFRATRALAGRRCPLCGARLAEGQLVVHREGRRWKTLVHAGCASKAAARIRRPDQLPPRESGLRVAVTGSRHYANYGYVAEALGSLQISVLAHGGATGADTLAGRWCERTDTPVRVYLADWGRYGPRAGPRRNRLMIAHFAPDLLVAFPGGVGTMDCARAAQERGVAVWRTWQSRERPASLPTGGSPASASPPRTTTG